MKKIILTTVSLLVTLMLVQAQPKLTKYAFYEDFSTKDELVSDPATKRGLFWWKDNSNNVDSMVRDYSNKRLVVSVSQVAHGYIPFGVSFGDDNGDAVGGNPYTIDLSGNGKFSFDITNLGKDTLSVRVSAQDYQKRMIDCSPGATIFGDIWKHQTQILILPFQKITFKPGTPNLAGGGLDNTCDFTTDIWGDYGTHTIRTDCDTKHIAGINITVLNGHKDPTDQHNVALVRGKLAISNFIVGDTSSKAYSVPNPVIALSDTVKTITDTSGSLGVININSFTNIWSTKTDVTWLTATIDTLSGKGTITVKASGNSSAKTRKAVVTLVSKFNITKTIVIIQDAGKLTASELLTIIGREAESSKIIYIKSVNTWSAKSTSSWLTATKTNDSTLVLKTTSAYLSGSRTATVIVSAPASTNQNISVSQDDITGFEIKELEKKNYRIVGNTIYFDNSETAVFTILGQPVSTIGSTSVTLPEGIYILTSPNGNDKIIITK